MKRTLFALGLFFLATANLGACSSDSGDDTTTETAGSGGSSGAAHPNAGSGNGGSIAGASDDTTAGGAGAAGHSSGGDSGSAGDAGEPDGGAVIGGSGGDAGTAGASGSGNVADLPKFSFFVTSLAAMQRLSGSDNGFGGDLRYGEANGVAGADKICTEIAETSMPGSGAKGWRAFLSAPQGPGGNPVNAIDRIGEGSWYDRLGRIVAMNKAALLNARPMGAAPAIINDLPNEDGVPNHAPDPVTNMEVDNHHFLTGSNEAGELYGPNATCNSWSATANAGRPRIGFSWPEGGRQHWISGQDEGGCGAGVNLQQTGGSNPNNPIVGSGGGYGGIYCFALMP